MRKQTIVPEKDLSERRKLAAAKFMKKIIVNKMRSYMKDIRTNVWANNKEKQ